MKICIDCAYVREVAFYAGGGFKCTAPQLNTEINPVTGIKIYPHASFIRSNEDKCGQDARWFQPKAEKTHWWKGLS